MIGLYRDLTECFHRSNYHPSAITQWQNYLIVFIVAYSVIAAVDLVMTILLASASLPTKSIKFVLIMTFIVAGFALDFFTIGVTIHLNMQASRQ